MKKTDEFENEIIEARDFRQFIEDNQNVFLEGGFHSYLVKIMENRGISRSKLINDSQISKDYAYQIFSGTRRPSRDKVIQLSVALKLELDEINRLMKLSGHSVLYGKIKRDACIIYALSHAYGLDRINHLLFEAGEKTLME